MWEHDVIKIITPQSSSPHHSDRFVMLRAKSFLKICHWKCFKLAGLEEVAGNYKTIRISYYQIQAIKCAASFNLLN
jgi:hypothetical protein